MSWFGACVICQSDTVHPAVGLRHTEEVSRGAPRVQCAVDLILILT